MAIIGVVADDFTGTASSGMMMAKAQVETGLFFDAEYVEKFENTDRLQAIYVSTNSRALSAKEAYESVYSATEILSKSGAKFYSKKIDTTLRGGIGYEIDAMLDFMGEDAIAVVVTAMPPSNRICVNGYSIIDGVLLTETSVAKDVKTPVTEAYVPKLLKGQSKRSVTLISLEIVEGETLAEEMDRCKEEGHKIIVIDAVTMEHVEKIAKTCVALNWNMLAVDPGPFTMKLACCRNIAEEKNEKEPKKEADYKNKTALIIAGSANPSTKRQMEHLCSDSKENKRISVSPYKLINGGKDMEEEVSRVVSEAEDMLRAENKPRALLIETALHGTVIDLAKEDGQRGYTTGTCSSMINQGLAYITRQILSKYGKDTIAGLMLTGGDTMECVCRNIGVTCIKAEDNIVAQVDVGRIIGQYEGMPLVVKGGFCGDENIAIEIVKRLHREGKE